MQKQTLALTFTPKQPIQRPPKSIFGKITKMEREKSSFDTFVEVGKCSSGVLKWHPQWQTLLMAYPICGERGGGQIWHTAFLIHPNSAVLLVLQQLFGYEQRRPASPTRHWPYLRTKHDGLRRSEIYQTTELRTSDLPALQDHRWFVNCHNWYFRSWRQRLTVALDTRASSRVLLPCLDMVNRFLFRYPRQSDDNNSL